jgi:hypothetical protein
MIYREYEIEASRWVAVSGTPGFDERIARRRGVALTPSVKVSSLLLPPGGFFF